MQQLYHVVAYNLAKSRTARDGNRILKRKNFKPKHLKRNGLMLVRDHTSKAFEPKAIDHHIVNFCGKNQVQVKDNYGNTKKVHVKDVKPIEMDIATAEFFRKEREQCTTRDAKHVMPIKLIPDLEWEFIENIDVMGSDKGITIYCVKETENENEATQVTKVSEPEIDAKTTENIEPVVTEAVEAPEDTQITEVAKLIEDTNITRTKQPRYEVSEQAVSEEIEVTDTIEITEVTTDIPELMVAVTSREKEESKNCSTTTATPPGSPQRENSKVQNNREDITEVDAEQAVKKTHKYPETNNSLVNKIFSVFRQAKESNPQPAPEYGLQM